MGKSLPYLAGIRIDQSLLSTHTQQTLYKLIRAERRFLHSLDDHKLRLLILLMHAEVFLFCACKRKTKLLVKLNLADVWHRVNILQSRVLPLVINHLLWINAVRINEY